ncbi:GNAT family N-acetyltransferase [Bacillus wiedmannii]|uniref:GNAT family N-acetyltransferase n=1 Tax=Bacillus wiedmannii TaxID=1890302 RepID=A0A4U2MHF1_9BACI|nr:GNAT family protein [Bacillus wiedmannii]TKH10399.1 GNAT family N-acetyltransferase [Bacillus wiedmannii]
MENDKLSIRKIKESDIELIRKWRNQSEIKKYFINTENISELEQQKWFENYLLKQDDIMFIVEEKVNFKTAIGTVALYNINPNNNSVELGRLMIGSIPAQGKGLGKQATILACIYAFEVLKSSYIYLCVFRNNIKAIKLYKSIGFVETNNDATMIHMSLNKKMFNNFLLNRKLSN